MKNDFALSMAIGALVSMFVILFLSVNYFFANREAHIYKNKYDSALAWIADGLPMDGRDELMRAIKEVIEDKNNRG